MEQKIQTENNLFTDTKLNLWEGWKKAAERQKEKNKKEKEVQKGDRTWLLSLGIINGSRIY